MAEALFVNGAINTYLWGYEILHKHGLQANTEYKQHQVLETSGSYCIALLNTSLMETHPHMDKGMAQQD